MKRRVRVVLELGLANPFAQSTGILDLWQNWMKMEGNEWSFQWIYGLSFRDSWGPGGGEQLHLGALPVAVSPPRKQSISVQQSTCYLGVQTAGS